LAAFFVADLVDFAVAVTAFFALVVTAAFCPAAACSGDFRAGASLEKKPLMALLTFSTMPVFFVVAMDFASPVASGASVPARLRPCKATRGQGASQA